MFNSREYGWADLTISVGTHVVIGARAIQYTTTQEKEALYGKGNEPSSIQRGNKSHTGTLTVLKSEYDALKEACGGSILDAQVNITVSYGNPQNGDVMKTDKLLGVEFTEEPDEMTQGDKNSEHALPFLFLRKKSE